MFLILLLALLIHGIYTPLTTYLKIGEETENPKSASHPCDENSSPTMQCRRSANTPVLFKTHVQHMIDIIPLTIMMFRLLVSCIFL